MKKFIFALLLASFTLMGVSCQKETEFVEEEVLSSVYFVAGYDEQPDTKATLQKDESYNKFIWQTGDEIRLYATKTDNSKYSYKGELTSGNNSSLGSFKANIASGSKVNYAAFPYDYSGGDSDAFLEYPAKISEYVSGGLFTPMLAVPAEPIVVAEGETYDDIYFNHVGGALKFTLKSVPAGVNSVVFTATENITGKYYVNTETVSTSTVKDGSWKAGTPQGEGKSVTFEFEALASAQDMVFYVPVLAGVKLTSTLSIVVNAAAGSVQTFEKTFKEGASYTVKRAIVANLGEFTVSEPVPLFNGELVTKASQLTVGSKIVIAASDKAFALGNQTANNRKQSAVTKSDNTLTSGVDTEIITLVSGNKEGTFALKVAGGYLYAASDENNYLRTEETLSDNSSWTISIDEKGVATIKAQGANTHNWLRYNSSSKIFSCYVSGQGDVVIYREDKRTALAAPVPAAKLAEGVNNSVVLTWPAVTGAGSYEVSCSGEEPKTVTVTTATFDGLEFDKEYTFSVVAKPENSTTHKDSPAGEVKCTTGTAPQLVWPSDATFTAAVADETKPKEVTLTWVAVPNAESYEIAWGSETTTVAAPATTAKVTCAAFETEYTFSIVAKADAYKSSDAKTTTAKTHAAPIKEVTVAAFKEASIGTDVWYKLTGVISDITNVQYGNFTLTDNSGSISVQGLTKTKVNSNDKSFASLGLEEGYTVTIIGVRGTNDSNPSVSGFIGSERTYPAYYVSHVVAPVLKVDASSLDFAASGESHTVKVTALNGKGTVNVSCSNEHFSVSGPVEGVYTVTAAANETTDQITSTLTFTYEGLTKEVALSQAATIVGSVEETLSFMNFSFTGGDKWNSTYTGRTVDFSNATVTFKSANKQSGTTITDCPVTKGGDVTVVMKNNLKLTAAVVDLKQWASKAQTASLYVSTDGGKTFATGESASSSNFMLSAVSLPEGTNAFKVKFSSTSNQVGIKSITLKMKSE